MSRLELRHIGKTHPDGFEAVRDLELVVHDGEFFVIVGPSGCGKTTVLRMIAGLDEPTVGNIYIDGVCVNDVPSRERDVAFAFQQHALYPHLNVADNIGFSLRLAGVRRSQIKARVRETARQLGVHDVLDRMPRQLSGGQQQRVALARSIIRDPRVFLMDEPMSNLDAKLRIESRAQVLRIQRRLGTTTMFVTHDQTEAMAIGDRMAVMRDGRIAQLGSPMEIYERPVDMFVAQFVGSPPMNIVRATVTNSDRGIALDIGTQTLPFDAASLARRPALRRLGGRAVAVGIRPEALHRDPDGPLRASVEFTEMIGPDQLVHATINAREISQSDGEVTTDPDRDATITTFVGAHEHVGRWQPFDLRVDMDALHLFDLASGKPIDTTV